MDGATRSDVYALGLTLYELLTLRPAFEASDRHELMRRVMSEEPAPLRGLVAHLPRDLETIVHKAIAREPVERYPSAAALAEDLQRFLDDKPIKARRVTPVEQAWRWARRNPAVASLAGGLLVALFGGLAGVTWQWRQAAANLVAAEAANRKAQARFDLAMEAVKAFTTGASEDVLLREKQLTGLRKRLLGGSLSFYDRLAGLLEGETDRASRRSLAQAVYDAAELNGQIGRREEAVAAHLKAIGLRQALAREAPADATVRSELARSELALGETFHALSRHDEAREALARSRAIAEGLLRERPGDSDARVILADGFRANGWWLFHQGRPGDARPLLERALEGYDHLIHEASSVTGSASGAEKYLRGRATCSLYIGRCFSDTSGGPEALGWFERAIAEYEELSRRLPGDVECSLALSACHLNMCEFLIENVDRFQTRHRHSFQRAEAILDRLIRENPTITRARDLRAQLLVGDYPGFVDPKERLKSLKRSLELFRGSLPPTPASPGSRPGCTSPCRLMVSPSAKRVSSPRGCTCSRSPSNWWRRKISPSSLMEIKSVQTLGSDRRRISRLPWHSPARRRMGSMLSGDHSQWENGSSPDRIVERFGSASPRISPCTPISRSAPGSRPKPPARPSGPPPSWSHWISRRERRGSWGLSTCCGISKADPPHRAGPPSPPAAPSTPPSRSPWYARPPSAVMST